MGCVAFDKGRRTTTTTTTTTHTTAHTLTPPCQSYQQHTTNQITTAQVDGPPGPDGVPTKVEYRVWNPFRSKLAAAILGGAWNMNVHARFLRVRDAYTVD